MKFPHVARFAAVIFAAATLACLPARAADEKPLTRAETEALVKKVIQDNPDLIFQTLLDYQEKTHLEEISKRAVSVTKQQDKLNSDPHSPSAGNPKGDITVVEFFDYHCGYCKSFVPTLAKLLDQDKNVRVVFKEFPILSEDSELAAKAALAVFRVAPAKYMDYHLQLMSEHTGFNEELLTSRATRMGVDEAAFKKALEDPEIGKDIDRNRELAHSIGVSSTPTIIIGTQIVPGAMSYEKLKQMVDDARKANHQKSSLKHHDE